MAQFTKRVKANNYLENGVVCVIAATHGTGFVWANYGEENEEEFKSEKDSTGKHKLTISTFTFQNDQDIRVKSIKEPRGDDGDTDSDTGNGNEAPDIEPDIEITWSPEQLSNNGDNKKNEVWEALKKKKNFKWKKRGIVQAIKSFFRRIIILDNPPNVGIEIREGG